MAIIICRTFIIYIALLVSMRFMGKRQLGELEVSELVVAVMVADVAASVGIDVRSVDFWRSSLEVVRRDIDTFCALCDEQG